jgi:transcriptional regulator of acetoin/glycerol metabolism
MTRASFKQRSTELARERFLAGDDAGDGVPATILRSWERCLSAGVDPSGPKELPFRGEFDPDCALVRAVRGVVEPIFTEIQSEGIAMLVSDAQGQLLGRWAEDRRLLEALDIVSGTPGYDCGEELVGTMALGTVLEDQHPLAVRGAEHFSDRYHEFSTFGAPIVHPVTGALEGAIDFTAFTDEASELMMPLVIRAAGEIGTRLMSGYAGADRALLDGYLRADRRGYRRPIVAMNDRVTIANPLADDLLAGVDRRLINEMVNRAIVDGRREIVLRDDERAVHASIQEVATVDGVAGAVVQLRSVEDESPGGRRRTHATSWVADVLPGGSAAWRQFQQQAAHAAETRQRTLLVGESGIGTLTCAERLAASQMSSGVPTAIDVHAASVASPDSWLDELVERAEGHSQALVLSGLEKLDEGSLAALCSCTDELQEVAWILAVYRVDPVHPALPAALAARFPHVLEVPPLRERPEDIPELVDRIAGAGEFGERQVDDAVKRTLASFDWPGNVRQLKHVVKVACHASRGTRMRLDDLPAQFRTPCEKRRLSRLEQVERTAIVTALQAADGNKKAAAADLGISRSTLYRRLVVLDLA